MTVLVDRWSQEIWGEAGRQDAAGVRRIAGTLRSTADALEEFALHLPPPDRKWTHYDLIAGRCSPREYVDDLRAHMDAGREADRAARADRRRRVAAGQAHLDRAKRLVWGTRR